MLRIMNVDLSDNGLYTCVARTSLDQENATALLTVLGETGLHVIQNPASGNGTEAGFKLPAVMFHVCCRCSRCPHEIRNIRNQESKEHQPVVGPGERSQQLGYR